jgi:LPS sulfotransferase NodH
MRNPIHRLSPSFWLKLRPPLFRGLGLVGVFNRRYTPFMVLTRSRSGSNLLARALGDHPQIVSLGEVLRTYNPDLEHVVGDLVESVKRIYVPHPPSIQAVGFKLLYQQGSEDRTAWHWLRDHLPNLKIIHLVRENALRVRVSFLIAMATGRWVKAKQSNKKSGEKPTSVHLDLSEWQDSMDHMNALRDEALSFFDSYDLLRVTYEEMTTEWDETTRRVQSFLNVTPQPLTKKTRKQNPQPLSTLISNYDEVASALRGTPQEWMLE